MSSLTESYKYLRANDRSRRAIEQIDAHVRRTAGAVSEPETAKREVPYSPNYLLVETIGSTWGGRANLNIALSLAGEPQHLCRHLKIPVESISHLELKRGIKGYSRIKVRREEDLPTALRLIDAAVYFKKNAHEFDGRRRA